MPKQRAFDVVIWGASGFTGRLVCEHLARDYSTGVRWALAGRSRDRLEEVRAGLAQQYGEDLLQVPILIGDISDQASLDAIAAQTSVLLSTAGPFALYGMPVVDAAVRGGCHYVDITGEVPFLRRVVERHHEAAAAKKLRTVPCCGFDSAPFDLGALLVVDHMRKRHGKRPARVLNAVTEQQGGVSGGTIASLMNLAQEARRDPAAAAAASTVYSAVPPEARGPAGEFWGVERCPELGAYLAPFVLQFCNCNVVHRSNHLLGYDGSRGGPATLQYQEAVAVPSWLGAKALQYAAMAIGAALRCTWVHPMLKPLLPKQGQGPSREAMLGGHYKTRVLGWTQEEEAGAAPTLVQAEVGDPHRDAGYWATSRMVLEAALCLALQQRELEADESVVQGGVLTPASAMGLLLVERLRRAGMTLQVLEG